LRLYRFVSGATGAPRIGVAVDDGPIVELDDAGASMLALIEAGPDQWAEAGNVARAADSVVDESQDGFRWLCPLDKAASLRDFLAFESHVLKGAQRRESVVPDYWYSAPVYYKGNHRSLIGPDETCPWPSYTEHLDFELELAMIVGRRGRDIAEIDAASHVFGFTVMNDFSARDIQAREMTAWLGPAKGKDFATALGPCIVTADELGPEPNIEMICRVNGEEWGRAFSGEMHWNWAQMLAHVSRDEDVWPGDVYGSGTPGGCCGLDIGKKLAPGDVVELEIVGIGILRSTIGTSEP
jgi:2-keto-4-pentenoate hydratase/2-oxohepta-3-ene-1,7-dioic acid hydratase in catechol pathway